MSRARALAFALVAILSSPAVAAPIGERLAAFNASLQATPCGSDTDCEARALAHGLDPELLNAIVDCENGDCEACKRIDDAMADECDPFNEWAD
jgi:hypothetical protein